MFAVYKKELKSYFTGMTGFVFIALFLLFTGIFVTAYNLLLSYASIAYAIGSLEVILLLLVPILSMKTVAEERRARTDRLLYALPLSLSKIVLAKYFAMLTIFCIPVLIVAVYPILLGLFGTVPIYPSYVALLALVLLGASLLAICMFLSSLTESQVIAAVIGFGTLLALYLLPTLATMLPQSAAASFGAFLILAALLALAGYFLTRSIAVSAAFGGVLALPTLIAYFVNAELFDALFPTLLSKLAVFSRFQNFIAGIFDLSAILYFVSLTVFFVFLTTRSLEKKRWN